MLTRALSFAAPVKARPARVFPEIFDELQRVNYKGIAERCRYEICCKLSVVAVNLQVYVEESLRFDEPDT